MPSPTQSVSASLESASTSVDKVTVSSASKKFCAELGVQTEPDITQCCFINYEDRLGTQGVQTNCVDQSAFEVVASPSTLSISELIHSESVISDRGPCSDDAFDDVFEAYLTDDRRDSDSEWEDQIDDDEEEEAFQRRLQAFKSKAPPISEEDNKWLDEKLARDFRKFKIQIRCRQSLIHISLFLQHLHWKHPSCLFLEARNYLRKERNGLRT